MSRMSFEAIETWVVPTITSKQSLDPNLRMICSAWKVDLI